MGEAGHVGTIARKFTIDQSIGTRRVAATDEAFGLLYLRIRVQCDSEARSGASNNRRSMFDTLPYYVALIPRTTTSLPTRDENFHDAVSNRNIAEHLRYETRR